MTTPSVKLYGTTTSPFVRRVRIVALELGVPCDLLDTATPAGDAALRAATPLWKVPIAEVDGTLVFDSHTIIAALLAKAASRSPLRAPATPVGSALWAREHNLQAVIDGALDAAIHTFYLKRDGVDVSAVAYCKKEQARIHEALRFVQAELQSAGGFSADGGFGLLELALLTALGWMRFRNAVDLSAFATLAAFEAVHAARPSVAATVPHT